MRKDFWVEVGLQMLGVRGSGSFRVERPAVGGKDRDGG